jgi:serine O-acetyltransferase
MIRSKNEYDEFLRVEKDYIPSGGGKNVLFPPPTWKFVKALRRLEYHYNQSGIYHKLMALVAYYRYCSLSLKTGISIPKNTCERGLSLYHFGSIVVNAACHIGENCCIMNNVNIGANGGSLKAPQIGKDVYIGPGAVIYGDIIIADGCYIGANAVVNKSFEKPNSVIAGIPAKVIKEDPIHWWEKNGLKR